jgi:predicted glycoside hydrolase/deacetylase ChbG (UPF0249 family)
VNAQKPQVIVNADDFGLHPAVNEAVERGHRDGIITSTSLMTLGDSADDAVRRARCLPSLGIGLHFCLVGIPGFPPSFGQFFAAALCGQFPARRIEAELKRQLDLVLRVHRLPISHIDSHQHLHALPSIMRVVCRVAAEYDIPGVRLPQDSPALASVSLARKAQTAALRAACRLSRQYISRCGRRTTDHFSGMAVSGHLTVETLHAYLRHARSGMTEIVCHPGLDNRALAALYDWQYDWEGELCALCAPSVRDAAQAVNLVAWTGL